MGERILSLWLIKFIAAIKRGNNSFLIGIVFLLFACSEKEPIEEKDSSHPYSEKLKEFEIVFPVLSAYEWEIHSVFTSEDGNELEMELDGKIGDTTVVAALSKWVEIRENNLIKSHSISRFIKKYVSDSVIHKIHTLGGEEELFHYYYQGEFDLPEDRIFIKGKWRYLYGLDVLDSLQTRYYLQNKDSLNEVKGDLLTLPSNQ